MCVLTITLRTEHLNSMALKVPTQTSDQRTVSQCEDNNTNKWLTIDVYKMNTIVRVRPAFTCHWYGNGKWWQPSISWHCCRRCGSQIITCSSCLVIANCSVNINNENIELTQPNTHTHTYPHTHTHTQTDDTSTHAVTLCINGVCAVLMASGVVILKYETSTLRQSHNFISLDLTFGVGDYVGEVTSPAKVGSGQMSGRDATWGQHIWVLW